MARTGTNPEDQVGWKEGSYEVAVNDTRRFAVTTNGSEVTGTLNVTGDFNAAGGFAQSFVFFNNKLKQGTNSWMTASAVMLTASDNPLVFLTVPMPKAGSIVGLAISTINTTQTVKSGTLSANVTINSVPVMSGNAGLTMTTGSYGVATFVKDAVVFSAGASIGVQLTGSAAYLCEPDITSASFVATVMVEM